MSGCPMNKPSFPMPRQCPFLPPQEYRDFQQQQGPVQVQMWDGTSAWLCTRYDDVRAVLGDNRFSGDPSVPGSPVSRRRATQCSIWSPRLFAWTLRSTATFGAC